MKICEKCGACNSDERRVCIDCGEALGEKLTEAQEKEYKQKISDKIERLHNRKDPLYVSAFDKIIGVISAVGVLASLAFIIKNLIAGQTSQLVLLGFLTFAVALVEAFFPKFNWALEKWRLSWYTNGSDDLEPGVFYFFSRKITMAVCVLYGIVAFCVSVLYAFKGEFL